MSKCKICGEPQKDDLFSAVTGSNVCSLCQVQFFGGLNATDENINRMRSHLKLADGEYLKQDRQAVARDILGR